ncbi:MAG: hypothetical protein ACI4M9_04575, partial [Succinivibrio sp.]
MLLRRTLICTVLMSVIATASAIDVKTEQNISENIDKNISQNPQKNAVFNNIRHGDGQIIEIKKGATEEPKKQLTSEQIMKILEIDRTIEQVKKSDLIEIDKKRQISDLISHKKE